MEAPTTAPEGITTLVPLLAAPGGHDLDGLVTANFDKESKYRTGMNVLRRPGSEGIEVIGHHELLIPLFHAAVLAKLSAVSDTGLSQAA